MKNLLLPMMLSLTLMACDQQDGSTKPSQERSANLPSNDIDVDDTGKNVRDRDEMFKTPMDQSENEVDREITQNIRQRIIADSSLSMNAKNIKIITTDGVVTLRGPVASTQEKDTIARKINEIKGVVRVDNQLEVTRNN